jgi:formylglycine-generating enzyme required for sulfatase activity
LLKLPESIVGLDGKGMRLVPAGPFVMGSDAGPEDERPQHQVRLDAFWIDATPVTNAEYATFVTATAYDPPSHWHDGQPLDGMDDHPVTNVSCRDAEAYARWAGKRLPTEAEWEKAARGTDGRIWPWGNAFHPSRCRSRESLVTGTGPVGAYSPQGDSPYGVSDMAGNVWEWTSDRYAPYEGSSYRCDSYHEENQVLRGGSWGYARQFCRCATRTFDQAGYAFETYGFRCVADKGTLASQRLKRAGGDAADGGTDEGEATQAT